MFRKFFTMCLVLFFMVSVIAFVNASLVYGQEQDE